MTRYKRIVIFQLYLFLSASFAHAQTDAEEIMKKGKLLHTSGQYDSALILFKTAATKLHKNKKTESYLEALNWIGYSFSELSEYKKADSILNLSLKLGLAASDRHSSAIAFSFHLLARLAASNGRYDESLELERKALNIRVSLYGKNDTLVAECYDIFAFNFRHKGYYDSSFYYYHKVLLIYENLLGSAHLKTSLIYAGLAWIYGAKGELGKCLDYNLKALSIQQKERGPHHPIVSNTLQMIAWCYTTLGDYGKALEYYDKTIDIRILTLGPDHPNMGHAYQGIGLVYHYLGDYDKAIHYYILAISIIEKKQGNRQPILVRYYNFLADALIETGDQEQAVIYLNKAEILAKQFEKNDPELVETYLLQAKYHEMLENPDQAFQSLKKALAISRSKLGGRHHFTSKVLKSIGILQANVGRTQDAISNHLEALDILTVTFGQRHPDVASQLLSIGSLYEKQGNWADALKNYHQALISTTENFADTNVYITPSREQLISELYAVRSLVSKARVLTHTKMVRNNPLPRFHAALDSYERAMELIDFLKNLYTTEKAKEELYESARDLYKSAFTAYLHVYELTANKRFLEKAFATSEKSKAFILVNALNDHHARYFGGVADSLTEKERRMKIELAFYKKRLFNAKSTKDTITIKKFQNEIFTRQIAIDRLVKQMEKQAPQYHQLKFDRRISSHEQLKKNVLDDKTALLEYFLTDSILYIFSLTDGGLKLYKVQKPSHLEEDITTFRNVTANYSLILNNKNDSDKNYARTAYSLYSLLLKKPLEELPPTIQRLVIVHEGILNQINFESLIMKPHEEEKLEYHSLPYVAKKFAVSYAYSATFLDANHTDRIRTSIKNFAGFAPSYGRDDHDVTLTTSPRDQNNNNATLEGTFRELQEISQFMTGDIWLGSDASETNFKKNASNYNILHLAMHGALNDVNPIYSSLLFAHEGDTINDGSLDLLEIYNLQLNAELAVLSACNTGAGKLQHGEGNVSISRAFSYAGCPSVVMSLWKIPDDVTAEIMINFYRNLNDGLDKDEALRRAKISFLSSEHDPLYNHPFFWAGFVLMGETKAIQNEPASHWILFSIAFVVLICLVWILLPSIRKTLLQRH